MKIFMIAVLLGCSISLAVANGSSKQDGRNSGLDPAKSSEGERLFNTHCVRCHKPPDDLPPRAAKAVIRHMRVRANLSEADERTILQYISPR